MPKPNTPRGRVSFPHLFKPQVNTNDKGEEVKSFEVSLVFSPEDQKHPKFIEMEKAAKSAEDEQFNGKPPRNAKWPIRDCAKIDAYCDDEGEVKPEFAGHVVVRFNTYERPRLIIDEGKQPIEDPTDVYGGCYGRALYTAAGFDVSKNRGTKFWLNGFQKLADGEPLGGGRATVDDFDDDEQTAGSEEFADVLS